MKPEKLSPKALNILTNMVTLDAPVTSGNFAFLATVDSGKAEWALSTLWRLDELGMVARSDRIGNAQSFLLTDLGRAAVKAQVPDTAVDIDETLYYFDGPLIFTGQLYGARRIFMAADANCSAYYVATPDANLLDQVISSKIKVVEGFMAEPCFCVDVTQGNPPLYALSDQKGSPDIFREILGSTAFLDPNKEAQSNADAECPAV